MGEYNVEKIWWIIIAIILIWIAGCKSISTRAGDESLVESRIITAVNAERNRWTQELSKRLTDGLQQVDARIDAVEGGLQQVTIAAREYRQFVLELIDSLHQSEGTIQDGISDNGNINLDMYNTDNP